MTTLGGLVPGSIFGGDFKVERLLGEGGMGAVYAVVQESTASPRALKLMQRELVQDPELRARFEQEARIGARIESDHVVQVVAAGIDAPSGIPWIAMELLRGLPLDVYLAKRGALPPGEVRFLFEQLCHALAAAHAERIVHRDLKPQNIFLSVPRVVGLAYVVKVLDFGIAKVLAEARTTRTAAVGTPLYMAPEQYQAGKVTAATDVWALGLIAFELLSGRSYWKEAAAGRATPATIMYETCMGELPPASARASELGLAPALPDGFDAWFGRAVCREPAKRFAHAEQAFTELAPLLGRASAPLDDAVLREHPSTSLPEQTAGESAASDTVQQRPGGAEPATGTAARGPTARVSGDSDTMAQPPGTSAQRPAARDTSPATELGPGAFGTGKPVAHTLGKGSASAAAGNRRRLVLGGAALGVLLGMGVLASRLLWSGAQDANDAAATPERGASTSGSAAAGGVAVRATPGRLAVAGTVLLDGRSARRAMRPGERSETYVLLSVSGKDEAPRTPAPVHLSLVIDRSGSMKGERIRNAIAAAASAVERLRDGDMVSVTAFDTQVWPVVAPTVLDATKRTIAIDAIRKLTLGSDTCVSCGLRAAMAYVGASPKWVGRILLLSDGDANVGVRDVPGFRQLGKEAQIGDVSITSIGVGLNYNERILSALSRESNGRHYFVPDEAALGGIFDAETKALNAVVATAASARLVLGPETELVKVQDRSYLREGSAIVVPLGQLSRGETKTVLVRVAVTPRAPGRFKLCDVALGFRDHLGASDGKVGGPLELDASAAADPTDLDPTVEVRVQRSETSTTLSQANELFAGGKGKEALGLLDAQASVLENQRKSWTLRRLEPSAELGKDLTDQIEVVDSTRKQYREALASSTPGLAAASPRAARAMRRSVERADAYAY
jgi:Ca-activated chloride channel family protein